MREVTVRAEQWPLKEPFVISRLTQETGDVVVVEIAENGAVGRGEGERGELFNPAAPNTVAQALSVQDALEAGMDRQALLDALPAGPARSAIDCALWDLEAKLAGKSAWELAGLEPPERLPTVFTISLGTPEAMATAARDADWPLLKLKLGGPGNLARVAAVREAVPEARLIVDANEGWPPEELADSVRPLAEMGVELLEQPLKHGDDALLAAFPHPLPIAADEGFRDHTSLPAVEGRYDYVNIKLDKAGGLTEALATAREAQAKGLGIMVGCNVGTSLAMAPAMLVGSLASFVDLDGPWLLAEDREPGLTYEPAGILPAPQALWG